ncbi:MAG: hypothetical protein LBE51_21240 [Acidovorax sp.]|jgi:hypothetical protein|nr:hypothetical protein [Acidovorax sp.]
MSLLDAPIWNDAGTCIVLGISLLFTVVGLIVPSKSEVLSFVVNLVYGAKRSSRPCTAP